MESFLFGVSKDRDDLWCLILDHLTDDAISLARFSMASPACQRRVFASLRRVLQEAAKFSTAAPNAPTTVNSNDPKARNDLVLPDPLFELWWTDAEKYSNENQGDNNDTDEGKPKKKLKKENGDSHTAGATQYDRLEGLGYYQAVVRAGLLQKRRVITNDRYSKNRVPHSALRMEKILEILETGKFRRSKSLYDRAFPHYHDQQKQPQPSFQHDSFYEPDCQGGIVFCLAQFMVWEGIFPNFNRPDMAEHVNIIAFSGRKKYRECELYEKYQAAVVSNVHFTDGASFAYLWSKTPLTFRLLIAAENQTTVKW